MKKKRKRYTLFVCALLLAVSTGCAEVPENVKADIARREQQKSDGKVIEAEASANLTPVADVVKNTPKIWKAEHGLIAFDGIVQVPEVTMLYKWKMQVADEAYQNPEKTREIFLNYFDNLEQKTTDEGPEEWFKSSVTFSDKEENQTERTGADCLIMDEDGFFTMARVTDYYENMELAEKWAGNESIGVEQTYYFDADGQCLSGGSDTWKLYDGTEVCVQEVMDQMEKFAEDYQEAVPSVTLIPDRIEVVKNAEEDVYSMEIYEMIACEGVKVDDLTLTIQNIKDYGNVCRLNSTVWQRAFLGDKYPYATSVYTPYKGVEKVETYETIVTLEEAWEALIKSAAGQAEMNLERADLLYSPWYEPTGDTNAEWPMQMSEPPEIYAAPVWRFVGHGDEKDDRTYAFYVDAVTGRVTAYTQ